MKKRALFLALLILSVFVLTSCDIFREPWPASEGYTPAVVDEQPGQGDVDTDDDFAVPDGTVMPTGEPTIDPDYNG